MIDQRNAAAPINSDLAFGAIGAATVVAQCRPSDAPAAETIGIPLALAIQQHRVALAAQDDAGRIHDDRAEKKRARPGNAGRPRGAVYRHVARGLGSGNLPHMAAGATAMTALPLSPAPTSTMDETPARVMPGHVIRQIAIVGTGVFWLIVWWLA